MDNPALANRLSNLLHTSGNLFVNLQFTVKLLLLASAFNDKRRGRLVFRVVRPAVRPLTLISRDAISPHTVEGYQKNMTQLFIT